MKKETLLNIILTLIVMMFLYASFSKYFDFHAFKRAMYNQPFPTWFSTMLITLIPPAEIVISALLFSEKTVKTGLRAFVVLMTLFTLYIAAILLHFFPRVPCSCGGIIRLLTWGQHLFFNLFFILIGIAGLLILNKNKRDDKISKESNVA